MTDYLLGIDRGTTNVKAVLFDLEGREIKNCLYPCEDVNHPFPGWSEQNMDMIWEVAKKSINNLWSEEIKSSNVIAIGLTGQGNGLFPIDKNGNPLRSGIVSSDIRAKKIVDNMSNPEIMKEVYKITRGSLYESAPITLLKWLKENELENYKNIDKILLSKDWIRFKLTGEISTDPTDASGGVLMDLESNNYSRKLFEIAEIPESWEKLPDLLPSCQVCGKISEKAAMETGLTQGTPVVTGAHDICAVSFAAGGIEEGHLTSTLGTWGLNMAVLDNPQRIENHKEHGLIYTIFSIVPKKGILVTGDANSGSALKWFVDQFCEEEKQEANKQKIDVYKLCDEKIKKYNPEDLKLIYHPFLNGSPVIKTTARAGFYGIGAWHNRIDLLRSIYEGVAFSQRHYTENIKKVIKISEHWLVGGGAKSHLWAQMFADVIGSEILTSGEGELAARGAALCAGLGVGAYKDFKEIKKLCNRLERTKTFTPQLHTTESYLKKYNLYMKLINRMDDIWENINDLF